MDIQVEFDVQTDGLWPEERLKFEEMVQEQIKTALKTLHPGEACICEYARYRYSKPEITITGD